MTEEIVVEILDSTKMSKHERTVTAEETALAFTVSSFLF